MAAKQKKATKVKIGLQKNTERTVYATWEWNGKHTKEYSVMWKYSTGNGIAFIGNETTTTAKQSVWTAPSNATSVSVYIKPISTTYKKNKKDVHYWTCVWSTKVSYTIKESTKPEKPSAPKVTIEKFKLTAEADIYDKNTTQVEFYIVKNDKTKFKSGTANVVTNHVAFSCTVSAGGEYKVRIRGIRVSGKTKQYGDWSEYSDGVGTIPSAPSKINTIKAISSTGVQLTWDKVSNATGYDVEYTTKKAYFDHSKETTTVSLSSNVSYADIVGLESGQEWFFRIRATNAQGQSGWCSPVSIVLGKPPAAPTTWSSTTTGMVGENLILYWVHNSEDGSSQTYAQLELIVNGVSSVQTIKNSTDEDEKDLTSSYILETSKYDEGAVIQWRVRTRGVIAQYGDWSIQRRIDIYAPPTLELGTSGINNWLLDTFNFLTDTIYTAYGIGGTLQDTITSFPYYITAKAGPESQNPIGYQITITANEGYDALDYDGKEKRVSAGDEVYSRYFDAATGHSLFVVINASDIDLENNISYTIHCTVSMDSGLTAEATAEFIVAWTDEEYVPDAEIGIDSDTLTAYIRPYCEDEDGYLIDDVTLSVYRREFDGTYTELARDIENQHVETDELLDSNEEMLLDSSGKELIGRDVNSKAIFITDPHPALDYARYRIVAMSTITGAISYADIPGYPVGENAAVIQWDEEWTQFDAIADDDGNEMDEPPWTGSMLKLPYNLDVSDKGNTDVTFAKYIGRRHPVSYYGTQIGETSTWNVDIVKDDTETLYALRRLKAYTGDVYVREPSGSGYWASVQVSFHQKHCELTIPVTLDITRVDGGA